MAKSIKQKLIKIDTTFNNYTMEEANELLNEGWRATQMYPIVQPVAVTGTSYSNEKGYYGTLVLFEKEE